MSYVTYERTRNRGTRMAESVRVLIADDQALLRGSFRVLVDSTPGMEVVGEAG